MGSSTPSRGRGSVTTSYASRCMPERNVITKQAKQRETTATRAGKPRQFLLRAKVDNDDERIPSRQEHGPSRQSTSDLMGANESLIFYSAYTHTASPTYFKWVNLTACDIHRSLTYRPGYTHSWLTTARGYTRDQPQLLFYLNHPVQFVQIVGVVVSTEEWYDRFWLFTIDDSSGYTIDVVCRKPDTTKKEEAGNSVTEDQEEKEIQKELNQLSEQVQRDVQIGAVLQVKGVVTLFQRRTLVRTVYSDSAVEQHHNVEKTPDANRQISLQRLNIIHDTNAEIALIEARTRFSKEVLSKPWRLSKREQEKLYCKASGESDRARKRAKRNVETSRKVAEENAADASKILADYEADEKERAIAAEQAKESGRSLLERLGARTPRMPCQKEPTTKVSSEQKHSPTPSTHKRKRQSNASTTTGKDELCKKTDSDTTMSFGIDEDEKSALLRAAFGI